MADDMLNCLEKRYSGGNRLLSNSSRKIRELLCVAVFLELAGVKFAASQLIPGKSDPPDVIFNHCLSHESYKESCNFEVTELLDRHTKRHDGMRSRLENVREAIANDLSFQDYTRIYGPVLPQKKATSFEAVLERIKQRSIKKLDRYRKRGINIEEIDLLVLVQSGSIFLKPNQNIFYPDEPLIQEWRSVSFLMNPYCGVIYLSKHAPSVLKDVHAQGLVYVNDRPDIWDEMITRI